MIALATAAAAVAGLVLSGIYYAVVPAGDPSASTQDRAQATGPGRPAWLLVPVELLRNAATAGLLTGLLTAAAWDGAGTGALLGVTLTVLPLVLLAGSVYHEGTPWTRAAAHAGDWLIKLPALGAVVGLLL